MYENLFVYALLYAVGYDTVQKYRDSLDSIVLADLEDYEAMELQDMSDKEAILHTLAMMESVNFDKNSFMLMIVCLMEMRSSATNCMRRLLDFTEIVFRCLQQ